MQANHWADVRTLRGARQHAPARGFLEDYYARAHDFVLAQAMMLNIWESRTAERSGAEEDDDGCDNYRRISPEYPSPRSAIRI